MGWVRLAVPITDPLFGKAVECKCGIVKQQRYKRLDDTFGFTDDLRACDLGKLMEPEGFEIANDVAREYVKQPRGWLYLWGPYGDGKTTVAAAIVNALRASGIDAVFTVAPDLLDWLKGAFDDPGRSYEEDWKLVKTAQALVVDDLGAERKTPSAEERIYELFGWRCRAQLPTIIMSNLSTDEMTDRRLASRFQDIMLCQRVFCGSLDVRKFKR